MTTKTSARCPWLFSCPPCMVELSQTMSAAGCVDCYKRRPRSPEPGEGAPARFAVSVLSLPKHGATADMRLPELLPTPHTSSPGRSNRAARGAALPSMRGCNSPLIPNSRPLLFMTSFVGHKPSQPFSPDLFLSRIQLDHMQPHF